MDPIKIVDIEGNSWSVNSVADKLRLLPEVAFTRMRNYQSEIGCGNCCADCSQLAAPQYWSLKPKDLDKITDAVALVASEISQNRNIKSAIACDRETRPDTLFPYFDNDLGSSYLFSNLLENIYKKLKIKSKFTTIGWSRHNKKLQKMHKSINKHQLDSLIAVSFSMTSYTRSWRVPTKSTSRIEYVKDLANALKTYRPAVDKLNSGKESACVTLRFKPMVVSFDFDLDDLTIDSHHIVHSGPYLLISNLKVLPKISQIDFSEKKMKFDQGPYPYLLFSSNAFCDGNSWLTFAKETVNLIKNKEQVRVANGISVKNVQLVKLSNIEGSYYAIDPIFQSNGTFSGKYFYHQSKNRPRSGFNDSERYLLNTLIDYKESLGLSSTDPIPDANWKQVSKVVNLLETKADFLSSYNKVSADYINKEIIPLVKSLVQVLKLAKYEASAFFDPGFLVDTGQILNQGRAISDFKGLSTTPNLATNPQHLRVISTWNPKTVWRWSIAPPVSKKSKIDKNRSYQQTGLVVQELNSADLTPFSSKGTKLREYFIEIPLVYDQLSSQSEFIKEQRIPGLKPISH